MIFGFYFQNRNAHFMKIWSAYFYGNSSLKTSRTICKEKVYKLSLMTMK